MHLTNDNYFTQEADMHYMSASQFKAFQRCEAGTLSRLLSDTRPEPTTPMLIGSYCDAAIEGTLDEFIEKHPELISSRGPTKGQLKAEFRHADTVVARGLADPYFASFLEGDKQTILTGEIAGVPFKAKLDIAGKDKIVDYKTAASFKHSYSTDTQGYVSFAEFWRYDIQGAIYQELYRQATGKQLPFYLAAVTTEAVPNIAVVEIGQPSLDEALALVAYQAGHFQAVKLGLVEPTRCETCDHCKATKKLTAPVDWRLVGMEYEGGTNLYE